jgi:hypothetical protein
MFKIRVYDALQRRAFFRGFHTYKDAYVAASTVASLNRPDIKVSLDLEFTVNKNTFKLLWEMNAKYDFTLKRIWVIAPGVTYKNFRVTKKLTTKDPRSTSQTITSKLVINPLDQLDREVVNSAIESLRS